MAGAYCKFCDRRCFVDREVIVGGQTIWSGHMATCAEGKQHDRKAIGMDSDTAHNPISDNCTCASKCAPRSSNPEAPKAGDVISIHCKATMHVRVTDVTEFPEPDFWSVRGYVVEGKGVGDLDLWHLFRREFDYVTRADDNR